MEEKEEKDEEKREKRKLDGGIDSLKKKEIQIEEETQSRTSGRQLGSQYHRYSNQEQIGQSRVVVTASNRRGDNDRQNMDKNVAPPRLHPTAMNNVDDYKVDYPNANVRIEKTQPSYLSGYNDTPARRGEPHSIVFGSSSNSRGAFVIQRNDEIDDLEPQSKVIRHPVNYYNPALATPVENFRPSKLMNYNSNIIRRNRNFENEPSKHREESNYNQKQRSRLDEQHTDEQHIDEQHIDEQHLESNHRTTTKATAEKENQHYIRRRIHRPTNEADPSILSQLGTISKSGVRRQQIDHRININRSNPSDHRDSHQRQNEQNHQQINDQNNDPYNDQITGNRNYESQNPNEYRNRERLNKYNFVQGEVYTPPPLIPRHRRPNRITTMRPRPPGDEHTGLPYEDTRGSYVPRYVKNNIQEMEFDPKTIDVPQNIHEPQNNNGVGYIQNLPSNYWFLMPVQAWFTLSITLAAVVFILTIVCVILYYNLKKQRRKVRKLLSPSLLMGTCIDPLHHELCTCRSITTLMRNHTSPMTRASMMSRMSHRSTMPGNRETMNAQRSGIINYDNASQQMTTGFRSLPTPSIKERDQMDDEGPESINTINTEVKISKIDDSPPPLAPKISIGKSESNFSSRNPNILPKYQESYTLKRNSSRSSYNSQIKYEKPPSAANKLGLKSSNNSEVQLTTIYPPPSRFEL